jgi:hypothetical protein
MKRLTGLDRLRSVSDWRLLIGWAIEEGLSFESGWAVRWNELNVRVGWLGSHRRVVVAQRALGFSLALLAAEELEQRGLPAVRPGRRPGRGRDSSLEACAERLREAAAVAAPGRLTWPKITDALPNGSRSLTASQIYHALYRLGITKETALRTALGRREALVSGRVVARTRGEWVTVMSAAIADGYTPGRGWVSRWKDLRARHPRYVSIRTLLVGAETCGGIEELYAAAIRGARPHVAPEPGSG